MKNLITTILLMTLSFNFISAQLKKTPENDSHAPLHLLKPDYGFNYGVLLPEEVKKQTDVILKYLNASTHAKVEDSKSHLQILDFNKINDNSQLVRGDFRIASYEWGVTYAGMLKVAETTKDSEYEKYVTDRVGFISDVAPYFKSVFDKGGKIDVQMNQILNPHALDDAGAVCASVIRTAVLKNEKQKYKSLIDNYMQYILHKEMRLDDGTFARNRPFKNTVWLDDMYMSIPAIAQYGVYTGENKYFDMAADQILLFAEKMFVHEKGLFRHGWVKDMGTHPAFHWGRANGWAILTICDVLDVLPENHKSREKILNLLKAHINGLASLQSGKGFWHQLLDKNDSYYETSCTAIFTYCIAHAINKGWIDNMAFGPVAQLGWNAVVTQITDGGRVEGTCVGTGMGFDPAFYYHRPVSASAAHGYGPVLLAGGEIYKMLKKSNPKMNDSAIQFYKNNQKTSNPIFSEE